MSKSEIKFILESPIIMPEMTNISGTKNHLVLRFGYKKNNDEQDDLYVINTSIALSHEQASDFAEQILEALEKINNNVESKNENK